MYTVTIQNKIEADKERETQKKRGKKSDIEK